MVQGSSNNTQYDRLPQGVIVSGNRFYDIEPFCCYLFETLPQKWGAVFPWDFPQHASKQDEEYFIKKQFDPVTVHMQGYRFLKQVFYSCALWNLHQRVPLVEQWFWDQPSNMELLNDPETQTYFLNEDVKPSTFFQKPELDLYGHRFLSVVVKAIQNSAREHLSKKEGGKKRTDSLSVDVIPRKNGSATDDDLPIKSAPPAGQEHAIDLQREHVTPNRRSTLTARDRPQFQPTSASNEPALIEDPIIPQNLAPAPKDKPPKSRKRGNSYTQRFNNRGGHFQPGQYQHYTNRDHSMQPFSPPVHPPPPPVAQGLQRGGPGFMPPDSHVQRPTLYLPGQYTHQSHPDFMVQHGAPHPPGLAPGQPIYYNPNVCPELGNGGLTEQHPNFNMRSFSNDRPPHVGRGGFRRGSQDQGSRGGKYNRGNSIRGGRGRGRDSFHSDDRPSFTLGPRHGQRGSNDHANTSSYLKGRRESINIHNWRSNSEHPQALPTAPNIKENVVPGFSNAPHQITDRQHAPFKAHPFQGEAGPVLYRPDQVNMRPPHSFRPEPVVPHHTVSKDHGPPGGEARKWRPPTMQCSQHSIGPEATFATKLVLFGTPAEQPIEEIWNFLSQFGSIMSMNRGMPPTSGDYQFTLIFLQFHDHDEARHFLASKPDTWPNGQPLRIEVAKEFWDENHARYGCYGLNVGDHRGYRDPPALVKGPLKNRNEVVPTVLQRPEREQQEAAPTPFHVGEVDTNVGSTDTTPTPSGANTPRKQKKKNNRGKKKADDLRKASLAAAADLAQTAESSERNNFEHPDPIMMEHGSVDPTTFAIQDNTASKATSEPETVEVAFTPAKAEATFAPEAARAAFNPDEASAASEPREAQKERSVSVETEVQTSQEPPLPPADAFQTKLPFRAFQTEESTEEEEAQATISAGSAAHEHVSLADAPPETSTKIEEEQVEDSFHTASDSPDSAEQDTALERTVTTSTSSTATEQQPASTTAAEAQLGRKADTGSIVSSEGTISPKTVKRVPVPEISIRPKVTLAATEAEPKPQHREQRSTSGDTVVSQPTAFVTTPTTPYISIEQPTENEPVVEAFKPEIAPAKKVEKSKGPAQTQSLSQFGKKNEKKTKSGKKGTLQGKPSSRTVSDSSGRVVSGTTTPDIDTIVQPERGRQRSKESEEKARASESKDTKHDDNVQQASRDSNRISRENSTVSQQETPSKRGGKLGNFASAFTGLFTGGQQLRPSSNTRSNSAASIKNLLTGSKAPDRLPSIDPDRLPSIDTAEHTRASQLSVPAPSQTLLDSSSTSDTLPADNTEHGEDSSLGLGISNVAEESYY